jgi:hypothetical protein
LFPLVVGDRYLHVLDVTGHLDRCWTTEQARNLITDLGERVTRFRFLMRDHERVRSTWTRSSPLAAHNAPTNRAGDHAEPSWDGDAMAEGAVQRRDRVLGTHRLRIGCAGKRPP